MRPAIRLVCLSALFLTGCSSIGPSTIPRDRFDYVSAISDSWKQTMVLDLLKVRYADAPVFMDVTSVINSYSLEGDISLRGQMAPSIPDGDTFGAAQVTGAYADKPTITYQPLSGERFARSIMAPIPVSGLLFLVQSGYPADLVLRLCVNSINGLQNAYGGAGNPRAGSPKFRELMTALRESQASGSTGFQTRQIKDGQTVVMFIRSTGDLGAEPSSKIRELLGLNTTAREFAVRYGSLPENDTEIAMLTRSILQIMIDFGSYIDVPAADIAEGRVYSPQRTAEQERMFPSPISVRHGSSRPEDAFVAVRYRNQWFWIDDRDVQSKFALQFLLLAFSLTEGASTQAAPVVTIPAR